MLRSLAIRNFTIIDELELEFGDGFGAITGETGAGKSILVDALSQLLGDRADTRLVAEGADRADLSATFELPAGHAAADWLAEQALDDETLVLRRVIPAEGASRAWINGQPAAIGQLREVGALLVEVHGQHEHQQLTAPARQRDWLDRHADPSIRHRVVETAVAHAQRRRELDDLLGEFGAGEDLDYLRYQLAELDQLALEDGEFETLETRQHRLASVEELQRAYAEAIEAIDGESRSALSLGHAAQRVLEPLADREPALTDVLEMLDTARVNLGEAAAALHRLGDDLENDPASLERVEQRMSTAIALARKHGVEPARLPDAHRRLRERLERLSAFDARRAEAEQALEQAAGQWREAARALGAERRRVADALVDRIVAALGELGMADARVEFHIQHDPERAVAATGADDVELLFSANPGQSPAPLKRVASGGELSRLGLALIIAGGDDAEGRVRIFDEIDAGVGGETAHAVGRFLRRASAGGQAFCVTHLAQVAACADRQFRVTKRPDGNATRVAVQRLEYEQRIVELARMLGAADAETGREHARAMLSAAQSGE